MRAMTSHNSYDERINICFMRIYDNENVKHKKAILIHHVTELSEWASEKRARDGRTCYSEANVVSLQRLSGSVAKNDNAMFFFQFRYSAHQRN